MALAVLLAAFAGWFLARSIAGPLGRATRVAGAIARGKLDNTIQVDSRDEAGQLLASMQGMQQQLQAVLAAQSEMAQRHDAGQISYRMDPQAFPGDFGTMVHDTNRRRHQLARVLTQAAWPAAVAQPPCTGPDCDVGARAFVRARICHATTVSGRNPLAHGVGRSPLSACAREPGIGTRFIRACRPAACGKNPVLADSCVSKLTKC